MILIAYDGSADARAAVERAAQLQPGGAATVLAVWVPFVQALARTGVGLGLMPGSVDYAEIDKASEQSARKKASEGAELAQQAGLDAQPHTRGQRTTIAAAILAEAAAIDASAIVVGTRGLTGVKSLMLGSVSHAVVQHADRPVVIVPSPETAAARATRDR